MATYNGRNEDSGGNILLSIGNGMTATLETGSTASQAYTIGSFLFFDNKLCKASTAIAQGDTLAIGTNLTQTTIGAELTSHLRANDGSEFYFDYHDGYYGVNTSITREVETFIPFKPDVSEKQVTLTPQNSNAHAMYSTTTLTALGLHGKEIVAVLLKSTTANSYGGEGHGPCRPQVEVNYTAASETIQVSWIDLIGNEMNPSGQFYADVRILYYD